MIFKPFEKDQGKFAVIADKLMNEYLYLSDEQRNPEVITQLLNVMFYKPNCEAYELGDMDGFISFYGIVPGHKAYMAVKFWNPKLWKPSSAKEARRVIDDFRGRTLVKRITIKTADYNMVKLGRIMGFQVEGIEELEFSWDGDLYDTYILALVPRGE